MPDPVSNIMPRTSGPSAGAAVGRPSRGPTAADDTASSELSFSGALERRMSADARPPAAPREPAARTPGSQSPDEGREPALARGSATAERPAKPKSMGDSPAADDRAMDSTPANAAADDEVAPTTDARREAPAAIAGPDAAAAAAAAATAALPAATPPALPPEAADLAAAAPATDPAAAASLAGLLPNVAALPAPPAGDAAAELPPGDGLLAGDERKPGAVLLEKLIFEATGGRTGLAPAQTAEAVTAAEFDVEAGGLGAASGRSSKLEPGALPIEVASAPAAAATASAATTAFSATPAAALHPLAADVQAAGLQVASLAAAPSGEPATPTQLAVPTPAGQPRWADDVGDRVMWMVGRNESKAELVLTPPQLGKLEVSIQVNGDQTTAHFVAATPAARDALEQAMPRLREMMQQAGINLGQANVSTSGEQRAGEEQARGRFGAGRGAGGEPTDGIAPAAPPTWVRVGRGIVDTFA